MFGIEAGIAAIFEKNLSMKQISILVFLLFFFISNGIAQKFNKAINKDSLIAVFVKSLPAEVKDGFLKMYDSSSETMKEMMLLMASMPKSSKAELIKNIDSNYEKVNYLKTEYAKLVPKEYIVSIEFDPEDFLFSNKESIDMRILVNDAKQNVISQKWRLEYNSRELREMLKILHWNADTLRTIKKLLADAHCVSIENGEIATIGFSRSGMGKYSYKLFNGDITEDQMKIYNDGCSYIFYKKNIVLEYGGGAIGSQCFPDK